MKKTSTAPERQKGTHLPISAKSKSLIGKPATTLDRTRTPASTSRDSLLPPSREKISKDNTAREASGEDPTQIPSSYRLHSSSSFRRYLQIVDRPSETLSKQDLNSRIKKMTSEKTTLTAVSETMAAETKRLAESDKDSGGHTE